MFATACVVFDVLGVGVDDCEAMEGVRFGVCACEAILLMPSGTALRGGGCNGEIETLLMEAEWAW
jgi:hypothetical protein